MEISDSTCTYTGKVVFERQFEGSKSERLVPRLITEQGGFKLHVEGDNPFSESALKHFEGKQVKLKGVEREGTIIVERTSIEIVE